MKPYRIDFVMGRGHEMTLDREGGIRRSDLDELEINMLKSQRIPCLLPLEWLEMDGNVTFRYSLSGKKMLLHKLQHQPLTMEQFYGLILQVAGALIECRDYMLRPEGCLLGDTFIFAGENLEDLSFVYVPLNSRREESAQGDDLLALVARWTAYVENVDGEGLRDMLQLFNGNRWPLVELRELLLDAMGSRHAKRESAAYAASLVHTKKHKAAIPPGGGAGYGGEYGEADAYANRIDTERRLPETFVSGVDNPIGMEAPDADIDNGFDSASERSKKRKWLSVTAFVLGAACIWRFVYLGHPSAQTLLVSLGLTMLLLVGAALLWRKGTELLLADNESDMNSNSNEPFDAFEPRSEPLQQKSRWQNRPRIRESLIGLGGTTSSIGSYALPGKPLVDHGYAAALNRGMLPPTVVLGANEAGGSADAQAGLPIIVLKRSWNGKEEEIPLESDRFQIGRAGEGIGYEEKADGVSRLHLEIVKEQGCHAAKDLGSRNGSLLNGTMMVPYKSYPIAVGDTIQLAGNKGPAYQLKIG
ncbi:DUF6382 domain-containing protein [Paenibacillus sp. LHD-117]|uniref:DUF6382 domain-containing protein n=1 Tax=Paenibacillus sp. LHD-117 TaxID=3071412 RepID=UPI0027E08A5E|nr:DUF6382 domain-containing protein [Paenibacillus sp. LHD-117]MDQ6420329.1 DUF6382 domain-containing protein [Paenibacillus sp. LHD-117]